MAKTIGIYVDGTWIPLSTENISGGFTPIYASCSSSGWPVPIQLGSSFAEVIPFTELDASDAAAFELDGSGRLQVNTAGLYEVQSNVQLRCSRSVPPTVSETSWIGLRHVSNLSSPAGVSGQDFGRYANVQGWTDSSYNYWAMDIYTWFEIVNPGQAGGGANEPVYIKPQLYQTSWDTPQLEDTWCQMQIKKIAEAANVSIAN